VLSVAIWPVCRKGRKGKEKGGKKKREKGKRREERGKVKVLCSKTDQFDRKKEAKYIQ
jgi:hypothetical protein